LLSPGTFLLRSSDPSCAAPEAWLALFPAIAQFQDQMLLLVFLFRMEGENLSASPGLGGRNGKNLKQGEMAS